VKTSENEPNLKASPNATKFRGDILGIRGIAILLVVANHFKVFGFNSGFIGVDVFFVVSGYLIVGLMYQEYVKNGRSLGGYGWISIPSFFQRRARRILPGAISVLLFVYITTFFIHDANFKLQTTRDVIWGLIFASNINFAQRQTDYFSSSIVPSPLLHYWSLAVEEQFYILMPFIFMAVANWHGFSIAGRRIASRLRLYLLLSVISLISFLAMVILSKTNEKEVYFSLFPRVWEFSIGALAALTLPVTSQNAKMFLLFLRYISFVVFIGSLFMINQDNFSYLLFLPVISTAIIIYVNNQLRVGFIYNKVLMTRVLKFFGKISFSLYLWHWPALIYPQQLGFELNWLSKIIIFALLILFSAFSERYIERPFLRIGYMSEFHLSPWLKSRRAMVGTLLVLSLGIFIATYQPIIASNLNKIQTERNVPFWTPPNQEAVISKSKAEVMPDNAKTVRTAPKYLGIFGDSTNQCCSAAGAFWPRIIAKKYGFTFSDYSKPATSYLNDGVGSNGCKLAESCPSVKGQLDQAKGKELDFVIISSGIGDCTLAKENPEEFQKSLQSLFRNFREKFKKALIVAVTPTYPEAATRRDCLFAVNPIISKAADTEGVNYVNGSSWIANPKTQMTLDGGHLNDAGHALFAARFSSWVEKLPDFLTITRQK
jgi:peptidoglycan/LPS O-acetylase OafA/YrhL/lysophospholipase L1-like esterase